MILEEKLKSLQDSVRVAYCDYKMNIPDSSNIPSRTLNEYKNTGLSLVD
jgi:hypothetical protein